MTKVLVTGGAGFIGYHLSRNLIADGFKVDILDNFSRAVSDSFIAALAGDPAVRLLDQDLLSLSGTNCLEGEYEYIFHFAAIIGVKNVLQQPFEVLRDNNKMLLKMLELAKKQAKLQRLVFASTSEVYAGTLEYFDLDIPTPESTPLALTRLDHPRTSYMLSKIYGEALCQHSGVPFTVIRPHNVYGPRMGMAHVIPELLKKAHNASRHGSLEVFSVDHRRTFCYVDDGVEMIKAAAFSDKCGGLTINIGNESPECRIGEVAEVILDVVGKELSIVAQPATPGSPVRRCPDMSQTVSLTGYQPETDLRSGIQNTYEWYLKNVFSGNESSAS